MRLTDANARCNECKWKTDGRNSMGNAAKHHKRTSHFIQVELRYVQTFGEPNQSKSTDRLLQPAMFNRDIKTD